MTIPVVGSTWDKSSMVWGHRSGAGQSVSQESPLGFTVQTSLLLSDEELGSLFDSQSTWEAEDVCRYFDPLSKNLLDQKEAYVEAIRVSTGFSMSDCAEIFDSSVEFVRGFAVPGEANWPAVRTQTRNLQLNKYPWGTVAAVLPQNAFFSLALTVLANGLATGNRVILRAPTGGLRLAAMLAESMSASGLPGKAFSVVSADAGKFIRAWSESALPCLMHFMGSSDRAPDLMQKSWEAGKPILIDGTGNTWVYVDKDQDPDDAAVTAWKGAIRYNGETCTSVNGVIVHPDIADPFIAAIRAHLDVCRYGCDVAAEVGPLFTAKQAEAMRVICERSGGEEHRAGNDGMGVFAPTIVVKPRHDSEMVREGVFAPALWVASGTVSDFERLWKSNRYPLCAGVFSRDEETILRVKRLPNASRIVVNGDPSVEDPSEPWGAYPRCGLNPVGEWHRKYVRTVQIDVPRS